MLASAKRKQKSRFDSYSVRNSVLMRFHVTLGIDACTFFLAAFLEIAVYI